MEKAFNRLEGRPIHGEKQKVISMRYDEGEKKYQLSASTNKWKDNVSHFLGTTTVEPAGP